jgi:hypothetical protein
MPKPFSTTSPNNSIMPITQITVLTFVKVAKQLTRSGHTMTVMGGTILSQHHTAPHSITLPHTASHSIKQHHIAPHSTIRYHIASPAIGHSMTVMGGTYLSQHHIAFLAE